MTTLDCDLLHPADDGTCSKKKRLIPNPRSYFQDVTCSGCNSTVSCFSHSDEVVICKDCGQAICNPSGGKVRLSAGASKPRRKPDA